jgi:hypothetical protein
MLDFILRDKDSYTSFLQKLDLIQTQDQIFMNISQHFPAIQSGVDYVLSKESPDTNVVRGLFKFMGQTDPTGLLYQDVALRHIKGLMTKSVPLHEYFDSSMAHIPQDEENLQINMAVFDQKNIISQLCFYVDKDITYLDLAVVQNIIG